MHYVDRLVDYWRSLSQGERAGICVSGFGIALIVFGVGWMFGIGGGMITLGCFMVILGIIAGS